MAAYVLRSVYSIEKRDFGEDKHGSWLGLASYPLRRPAAYTSTAAELHEMNSPLTITYYRHQFTSPTILRLRSRSGERLVSERSGTNGQSRLLLKEVGGRGAGSALRICIPVRRMGV